MTSQNEPDGGRKPLLRRMGDWVWRALHRAYLALPASFELRERLKGYFYAVHGRLFPQSESYRIFLESRRGQSPLPTRKKRHSKYHNFATQPPRDRRFYDVLIFPVIDWHFRHQRPQQLALALSKRGHRVVYFSSQFTPDVAGFRPDPEFVAPDVCVVALPCAEPRPVIYETPPHAQQQRQILEGIEMTRRLFDLGAVVSLVQHPFWLPVARRLTNSRLLYDCMDHHGSFSNTSEQMLRLEEALIPEADLVVASSHRLYDGMISRSRTQLLIRNAADYDHFSKRPKRLELERTEPVIGYYGAIADWFDSNLVAFAARALPHCRFVLIGSTHLADTAPLEELPNLELLGELPYEHLPAYLHAFDVCIIPFQITELTRCTNPVKVYEFLAAGKPVVSVPLPELEAMGDVLRLSGTPEAFVKEIQRALEDRSPEAVTKRRAFARENTWAQRAEALEKSIQSSFPKVSVIVLTYNQLEFTKACLQSLEQFTDYPNWELILVDNGSEDGTADFLRHYAGRRSWVRPILNQENRGFAAGNNQGAREATGDYLVFMNNDTYVTRGWMGDLLRHFQWESRLGMLNPVTNNIGNEARIDLRYDNMAEMAELARAYTSSHFGQRLRLQATAFFCVMIPRPVWEEVGELDERFGTGFFEDDDYSKRAIAKGYQLACAEDVYVHHHLSASFDLLDPDERNRIFEENKRYYESKWSTWEPHRYRDKA